MKERPILFNSEMVRAILEGRKTQTRRIFKCNGIHITSEKEELIKLYPNELKEQGTINYLSTGGLSGGYECPFGKVGDRLWVRETIKVLACCNGFDNGISEGGSEDFESGGALVQYQADMKTRSISFEDWMDGNKEVVFFGKLNKVIPSIHMPRWASRITLELTNIRVERLQDITEQDAIAEGCSPSGWIPSYNNPDNSGLDESLSSRDNYAELWERINGVGSWNKNPWVWVIGFKKVEE